MTYGPFEALEASESEHRIASNAANRTLDEAIVAVKARHAAYLNGSEHQRDFYDRLKNVRSGMRQILEAHGIHPAAGPMNRVIKACRDDARPHWTKRAADGTSVADAAPSSDLSTPIGVLDDNPIGAVASRRTAVREVGPDDPDYQEHALRQYEWEKSQREGPRTGEDIGHGPFGYGGENRKSSLSTRRVGGGFREFLALGPEFAQEGFYGDSPLPPVAETAGGFEAMPPSPVKPQKRRPVRKGPEFAQEGHYGSVSDRQYLAALITGEFEEHHDSLTTPLVPEGDFDAYLNQVTDPAADRASEHPFGARDGEHDWENTGKESRRRQAAPNQYDQEEQHAMNTEGHSLREKSDPAYHEPKSHQDIEEWNKRYPKNARRLYAASVNYYRWCERNQLRTSSIKNLTYFGSRIPLPEYTHLLNAIRVAYNGKLRRQAAGKDHLQTSQDAITKMLNELAEDFQKSIMPLQDALQSVNYAQQSMNAQSPMNVMPPGSVNVMPEGMQDPNAAMGGAPPMQGQGMPAAPGPGGLSPMVDPAATGGAPAGPPAPGGGGGDPMAGLPPELLQALMGAGGGGGQAAPPPAQRPVAAKKKEWYEADDDDDDDDEPDKDDGFGGKKAPPFGSKDSRRHQSWVDPHDRQDAHEDRQQREHDDRVVEEGRRDGTLDEYTGPTWREHDGSRRRLFAEFPPGGFGGDEKKDDDKPKDDGPPKDDKPKPDDGPPKDGGDDKPPSDGPPEGGPPDDGGGKDQVVLEAVIALLDAGDLPAAQALAQEFDITDDDVNSYAPDDPYATGDPYADPASAGPPPPVDAGPPPPPDAGPPMPPPGPPPPGPGPEGVPPEVRAAAAHYIRWAAHHQLPINRQTVEMFHYANNPVEESRQRQRSRRPLATTRR